jgi:hypothetical protein
VGSEFQVNTYTTNNQGAVPFGGHLIASDSSGDFVVVWNSQYQDGDGYGIFAQRYDSLGGPVGTTKAGAFSANATTVPALRWEASSK